MAETLSGRRTNPILVDLLIFIVKYLKLAKRTDVERNKLNGKYEIILGYYKLNNVAIRNGDNGKVPV